MKRKIIPLLFAGALGAMLTVGFDAGKTAFTKRYQTALLKEPQPLAESTATLPLGASVKIVELQGKWANVSATNNATGWVYLGNLSEEKPFEDTSIKGLQASAGETTASVAARPLNNVTTAYAEQEGLGQATNDLQWLEIQSDTIDSTSVVDYLKTTKKGAYQ